MARNGRATLRAQPVYDGDVHREHARGRRHRAHRRRHDSHPRDDSLHRAGAHHVRGSRGFAPGIRRTVSGQYSGSVVESSVVVPPARLSVVREGRRGRARRSSHSRSTTGPGPSPTLQIVDILKREQVPGHVLHGGGDRHEASCGSAKRVADAGMLVGSHSFSHRSSTLPPKRVVRREVAARIAAYRADHRDGSASGSARRTG